MKKTKRTRKKKRLQPSDVLRTRMEYYNELARSEMKKGERGSREKIDEYLKQAQDAAKELAPYLHGKAQAGESDEPKKRYVIRVGQPHFETLAEWSIYYKAVEEKLDAETIAAGGDSLNAKMKELLENFRPSGTKLN